MDGAFFINSISEIDYTSCTFGKPRKFRNRFGEKPKKIPLKKKGEKTHPGALEKEKLLKKKTPLELKGT